MPKTPNIKFQDFAVCAAAFGIAAISTGFTPTFLGKVVTGLALGRTNFLINKYDELTVADALENWRQGDTPNHDLQNALIEAICRALDHIQKTYLKQYPPHKFQYKSDVKGLFKRLKKKIKENFQTKKEFESSEEEIKQLLDKQVINQSLAPLLEQLESVLPQLFIEGEISEAYSPELESALAELQTLIPFFFGEVLKDPKFTEAWRAFIRLEMTGLKTAIQNLTDISTEQNTLILQKITQLQEADQQALGKQLIGNAQKTLLDKLEGITQEVATVLQEQYNIQYTLNDIQEQLSVSFDSLEDDINVVGNKVDNVVEKVDELGEKVADFGKKLNVKPPIPEKILCNTPPAKPHDFFIGRADDLIAIAEKLEKNRDLLLLNGMGGIGKSMLAAAYWHKHLEEYEHLIWVVVPDGSSLEDGFRLSSVSERLQLAMTGNSETDWKNLLAELRKIKGKNLLVLDNVNDDKTLARIAAELGLPNWTKLLTSRSSHNDFVPYTVEVLPMELAKQLFTSYCPVAEEDMDLLETLLLQIEQHTLSIELLAKNLAAAKRYNLQQLYDDLHKKGILQLSKSRAVKTTYQAQKRDYAKIKPEALIKAMFDLQPLGEDEQWLLLQLSVLPSIPISCDDLYTFLGVEDIETNEMRLRVEEIYDNSIDILESKGWITAIETNYIYKVHPIIQEVVRTKLEVSYEKCKGLVWFFNTSLHKSIETNPLYGAKYVAYVSSLVKTIREKHRNIATLASNLAIIYQALGNFNQALHFQKRAINIREQILERMHPDIAQSYNNLATIYQALGKLKQALYFQTKAIDIREQILDSMDFSLATSYNNLAGIYDSLGERKKALYFQKKTINIQEQTLIPQHPYIARSYNNLAMIYKALGDFKNALIYQKKAINIQEQILDSKHPNLTTSYSNLAMIYRALGDFKNALIYQKKAITIQEQILDSKHPSLATSYNNLAMIYKALGDLRQSLRFQTKAILIGEQSLELMHPNSANFYNNLSLIYKKLGELEQAIKFQRKAIHIRKQIFSPMHTDLAVSYMNLSTIYMKTKELALAKQYIDQAVSIFQYNFPNGHPHLDLALNGQKYIDNLLKKNT